MSDVLIIRFNFNIHTHGCLRFPRDQSKKEIAVRILQKFTRNKLSKMFSWKRVMNNIDVKETSKLSNSLLYQASQPVAKPAIFDQEEQEQDKTFLTATGGGGVGESASTPPSTAMSRRVSRANVGEEISPGLARLQKVMHVEIEEKVEEDKHVARQHFRRLSSSDTSYFINSTTTGRPHTAPAPEIQQDNELDAQDLKHMTRHDRMSMLASASTSSVHAVNAARMLLHGGSSSSSVNVMRRGSSSANILHRGSSSANMLKKDRPPSGRVIRTLTSDDDDEEEVTEYDVDKESGVDEDSNRNSNSNSNSNSDSHHVHFFSPKGCDGKSLAVHGFGLLLWLACQSSFRPTILYSLHINMLTCILPTDPSTHRVLGRFDPKKQTKKQQFNRIINRSVIKIHIGIM